ncbi:MAG: ABC transporter ATP-binding protein [Thermaerobacter sp.]|nr:ABC transporter ATP-binding protein [Thermaerobacter sp.]
MIQTIRLGKRFGKVPGIQNLSFSVPEGEVFGFVGPNGAGKSTTIRCLMGFMRPTSGQATINGRNCWAEAPLIHQRVGYIPGEVVLPENIRGLQFLRDIQRLRGVRDGSRLDALIARFGFDPDQPIRLMSKGTRQKLAIVAAFLHDPPVLILDEPTSGLDPLMQKAFVELIQEEHARGKTIFLSSHIFSEIERTCDRVAMLKSGQIVTIDVISSLRVQQQQLFEVTLAKSSDVSTLSEAGLRIRAHRGTVFTAAVHGDYPAFFKALATLPVINLQQHAQDLETSFLHFYRGDET